MKHKLYAANMRSHNSMGILISILCEDRLLTNVYEITELRGGFPNNILTNGQLAHPSYVCLKGGTATMPLDLF